MQVVGAQGLAQGLDRASKDQARALAKAHRDFARRYRDEARARARAGTKRQAKMAGGIGSSANRYAARLTVRNTVRAPGATPTFYGTRGRTGWAVSRPGRPQHPPWVGNDWEVATRGQGPYVINALLADRQGQIEDEFLAASWSAIDRHVPARPRP